MSLENKTFLTDTKKKNSGSQNLKLEFSKFLKNAVATKITKIHKSVQNWYFYLSFKQIITFEFIITSLSGRIFKMQQ